jgi:N-acetylglucosamine-6-sulfatase
MNQSFGWRVAAVGLLATAVIVALALGGPAPPALGGPTRPNIVVLMTDDQTRGEMLVMRKTLAQVGRQGVTFDRFISSYPLCCPARATFLTGQYAHNHGVVGNGTPVGGYPTLRKQHTLASWLQDAGYHTVQIGKFFNGYPRPSDPNEVPPGWDEWYGAVHSTENLYFNYRLVENGRIFRYGSLASDYSTDVFTRKAVEAIGRRAALGAGADPLFMFVAYNAPHLPARPAPRDSGQFRNRPLPRALSFNEANVSDKPRFIRSLPRFSAREVRKITGWYRDRVESLLAVDDGVERVIGALRRGGMLDDTYLLFISDNGFFFGQHRLPKGKYLSYEGSSRVPLLIRGPGIPRGRDTDSLLANVDLAPTILQLAGATASVPIDGRSLLPYARNPGRGSDRAILLEALTRDTPSIGIPYTGILTERYKYIRYRNGEQELYDLKRDPGELRSRHRDPAYRRTKAALAAALAGLQNCRGAACRAPAPAIPGPN